MSSAGEHLTLMFVITLLSVFTILVVSMPSGFLYYQEAYTTYARYTPPDRWQFRDLEYSALTDVLTYEDFDISFPSRYPTVNVTNIIDYVEWGYVVGVLNQNQIVIFFTKMPTVKYAAQRDYVLGLEVDGWAMIYLDHITVDYSIRLSFGFDTEVYDSLEEAWNAGHLRILIETYEVTEGSIRYSMWDLLGQLLLFQAPNIHPLLNAMIAIPIWAAILISIAYVWDKVWPF